MSNLANCSVVYGCSKRFDPPTKAASHSPFLIALKAASNAYIELEHAVSMRKEGPFSPRQ